MLSEDEKEFLKIHKDKNELLEEKLCVINLNDSEGEYEDFDNTLNFNNKKDSLFEKFKENFNELKFFFLNSNKTKSLSEENKFLTINLNNFKRSLLETKGNLK